MHGSFLEQDRLGHANHFIGKWVAEMPKPGKTAGGDYEWSLKEASRRSKPSLPWMT